MSSRSAAAILAVAIARARRVLIQSVAEGAAARELSRFVPSEVAKQVTMADSQLQAGQGEVGEATIFFCDIEGFTTISENLSPRALIALLNEYLSEMAAIADSFGTTINQFVGDGIMIFFGAPDATTDHDHALRAVRMAQAMQRRMGELGEKWFVDRIARFDPAH